MLERLRDNRPEHIKVLDRIHKKLGKVALLADDYFEMTGMPVDARVAIVYKNPEWVHEPRVFNDGVIE